MPTADPIRTLTRQEKEKMQVQATPAAARIDSHKFVDSLPATYMVSVASASTAEMFTYPLDLTKTRLQLQGEIAAGKDGVANAPYRGMLKTGVGIAKEEGILKLWQGVTPAIYRHMIYSGTRIVFYEWLKRNVLTPDEKGHFALWKSALNGATAGACAQFVASPADLVKVQIQMEGKRRLLGKPPRCKSPNQAFMKIWQVGGIRGLWKGAVPNMQRAALVNLGDLSTYDFAKRKIMEKTSLPDSHLCHFLSRGVIYKNSWDCLKKTVKNEGLFALYKGFLPVWIRLAPWSLTFWMTFEQIRFVIGAESF